MGLPYTITTVGVYRNNPEVVSCVPHISHAYSLVWVSTSRPAYKLSTAMEDTNSTDGQQKRTRSMQLLLTRDQLAYETRAEAVEDSYFQLGGSFLTRCTDKKRASATARAYSRMETGGTGSMLSRGPQHLHARCALQSSTATLHAQAPPHRAEGVKPAYPCSKVLLRAPARHI